MNGIAVSARRRRNAKCIEEQARLKQAMEKYGHAEWLYRRALEMVEKGFGPKGPEAAPFLNNFGTLYSAMGEYEKVQAHFHRAYGILSKAYGPNDPDVGICRRNLANAKAAAGQVPRPKGQRAVVI